MSHGRERKDKNCLNCGTIVQGRYCQTCGQENLEPKESFWSMLRHFFEDITHFDGKFFITLKDLLFRPGFLSAEYIKGKRASYLHPVRMYVFTSAIFFLIFFSISGLEENNMRLPNSEPFTMQERDSIITLVKKKIKNGNESVMLRRQLAVLKDTSRPLNAIDIIELSENFTMVSPIGDRYTSRVQYDSAQRALPVASRDGWFKSLWNKRAYSLNDKYKYDPKAGMRKMVESFLHRLPYLLFISLPFFAGILKLLYIRRKQFFYADHGIFSIHHYILSFILLLFCFGFNKLDDLTGWGIWDILTFVTAGALMVYLYLAMKKFYGQGRLKTFAKFFLLNIIGLILIICLMVVFFLFSIYQL